MAKEPQLKVGDILVDTGRGFPEFFKITSYVSKTMVTLDKLEAVEHSKYGRSTFYEPGDKVAPMAGKFKVKQGIAVDTHSAYRCYARPWDGTPIGYSG